MSYTFTPPHLDSKNDNDKLQANNAPAVDESLEEILNLGKAEDTRDILATQNIESANRLLNYELAHFGYAPLVLDPESENSPQLVRTLFALLGQQHSNRSYYEEYEERLHRLAVDHKHATNSVARLKEKMEQSLRENESLKLELRQAVREIKQEKEKGRALQEELKQTRANHIHSKNQFAVSDFCTTLNSQHDLRKKEVEITRAKDRTQRIINDKYKAVKLGLVALNSSSIKSTPPVSRTETEDDYYSELVHNYIDREERLNNCYRALGDALAILFNAVTDCFLRDKNKFQLDPTLLQPEADIQKLLVCIDELTNRLKYQFKDVSNLVTTPENGQLEKQAHQISSLTSELTALESSIEQYRQKISEQDVLLQASKLKQTEESTVTLRVQLTNERMALERDRAKVNKLAILLGQERAEFVKAKAAFEKERELFESQKAFDIPATPQWLLDMDHLNLDDVSEGNESDTLARLLQKGESMATSPINESEGSSKKDQPNHGSDLSVKPPQNARSKLSALKPQQKLSTRQTTSSFARPTAAALLKAQVTKSRLVNRREGKQRPPSNLPTEIHSQRFCKRI
ncbi:hypothetical protein L0F63_003213 [Massospora cicadina]|nr:hypothetical protein L0F63_003213 [Massospora cicadina]